MTKFCVDCKHCMVPIGFEMKYALCNLAPKPPNPEYLVTKEGKMEDYSFCVTQRDSTLASRCGVEGTWFEPKLAAV